MPYGIVGDGVALIVAVVAFLQAGLKGRIVIAGLMGSAFLIPTLIGGENTGYIFMAVKAVIAIGCYLYIRVSNAM